MDEMNNNIGNQDENYGPSQENVNSDAHYTPGQDNMTSDAQGSSTQDFQIPEANPTPKKKGLKKKIIIATSGLAAAALVTVAVFGANGNLFSKTNSSGTGTTTTTVSATATSASNDTTTVSEEELFTKRDLKQTYDSSEAETINLSDDGSTSSSSAVTIEGNTITITEAGIYVVSGTLSDGQIVVDCEDEDAKVQIVLDNTTISNSSSACIYAKAADKVFVTTEDGSTNTLTVTGEFVQTDNNNVDGAIFSKCDLTVNGKGTLDINDEYGHGIVSKDDLKITGSTLNIDVAKKGLQGKDSVRIDGGTINITAGTEGIEGALVYVLAGDVNIDAKDDGINASDGSGSDMGFGGGNGDFGGRGNFGGSTDGSDNGDGGFGGRGNFGGSTDGSDNSDGGFGGGAQGFGDNQDFGNGNGGFGGRENFNQDSDGTGTSDSDADNTNDGSTSDDVSTSSNITVQPLNANIPDTDSMSSATVLDGSESSTDIAKNTDDSTSTNTDSSSKDNTSDSTSTTDASSDTVGIYITGGTLNITADGDGIDSNGFLNVYGGTIYINGPTSGGDGALDYQTSATITGGTVIAAGSSGMAENFGSNSTQGTILYNFSSSVSGEVTLKDSDGNVIASYTPTKEYQSVVISSPEITNSGTYTISAGNESEEITMSGYVYGSGNGMGGGRMGGGPMNDGFGGRGNFGGSTDGSDRSDSSTDGSFKGGMQENSDGSSNDNFKGGMRGMRPDVNSDSSSDSSDSSDSNMPTPPDMNNSSDGSSDSSDSSSDSTDN